MKRIGSVLVISGGLIFCVVQAGEVKTFVPMPEELELFELTNMERKKKNLPPLTLKPALSMVARRHSANMARQGKLEHKLDGKTGKDRLHDAGCKFKMTGENLAMQESAVTMPAIMKGLIKSPEHRKNILEAEFTEVGVGLAFDANGDFYITQVFIQPRKQE